MIYYLTPFIPFSWEERGRRGFAGAKPLQTSLNKDNLLS
jgi:hypothetical protein